MSDVGVQGSVISSLLYGVNKKENRQRMNDFKEIVCIFDIKLHDLDKVLEMEVNIY